MTPALSMVSENEDATAVNHPFCEIHL